MQNKLCKSRDLTNIVLISYRKIMANYNDDLIISPDKMDIIAKKYFEVLSNQKKGSYKKLTHLEQYNNAMIAIAETYGEISILKKLCSNYFYNTKFEHIKKILSALNMTLTLPLEPIQSSSRNYCQAITRSLYSLNRSVVCCTKLLNENISPEDKETLGTLIINITKINNEIVSLIGECKYRPS